MFNPDLFVTFSKTYNQEFYINYLCHTLLLLFLQAYGKERNENIILVSQGNPQNKLKRICAHTLHLKNTGRNTKMIVSLEGKLHGV